MIYKTFSCKKKTNVYSITIGVKTWTEVKKTLTFTTLLYKARMGESEQLIHCYMTVVY